MASRIGGFVAGNPIEDHQGYLQGAARACSKGRRYNKALYVDLLAMLFEMLWPRYARRA
ncbi:MAG: hypothetical protein QM803_17570 [Rhodocyclaceae bacterium]